MGWPDFKSGGGAEGGPGGFDSHSLPPPSHRRVSTAIVPQAAAIQAARRHGDRPCLSCGTRRRTFAQFEQESQRLACALSSRLDRGSRVGLFMANRAEYLLLQFAIERAGLVRVPLNMRYTAIEVAQLAADSGAAAIFCDAATADRAEHLRSGQSSPWIERIDDPAAWKALLATDGPAPEPPADDDICSINYTTGTSGKPKGVVLTHRNWSAVTRNMLVDRDIRGDDVVAHIGPLTHASGTYFLPWYLRGAHQVLVEGGTVDGLLETIARERVTTFTCVPTVLTRIVNHPRIDEYDLSSLRAIGYGAEPIPANTLHKALERFGSILTQNYGLTEAMMTVTTLRPELHWREDESGRDVPRVGCIGRPYTFVEVVLRGEDGRPVDRGTIGELTIHSEHVMKEYWGKPEETAKVLRDGWLWSGDLGREDESGLIYLSGRSKDMLISGGFNIYPAELEAVLTSHAQVMEAAVVGVPDSDWGEAAVAYVVYTPGAAPQDHELIEHCKPHLGIRTPRRFVALDALPKNANGKADKPALRKMALEQFGLADA